MIYSPPLVRSLPTLLLSSLLLVACIPAVSNGGTAASSASSSAPSDKITVTSPQPNATVQSPLTVTGEARGPWYFEASFPIVLQDDQGQEITTGIAQAQGEWMTTDFVPFMAVLTFSTTSTHGKLILKKDNPSGLPENDEEIEIPVVF